MINRKHRGKFVVAKYVSLCVKPNHHKDKSREKTNYSTIYRIVKLWISVDERSLGTEITSIYINLKSEYFLFSYILRFTYRERNRNSNYRTKHTKQFAKRDKLISFDNVNKYCDHFKFKFLSPICETVKQACYKKLIECVMDLSVFYV